MGNRIKHSLAATIAMLALALPVAAQGASRGTLVVTNETDATLTISLSTGYHESAKFDKTVPPRSKIEFFNHLPPGRHFVIIEPRCVTGVGTIQREIFVSGTGRYGVAVNSASFGQRVMLDRPNCGSASAASTCSQAIVGQWQWFNGITVSIAENHTFTTPDGNGGSWACRPDGGVVLTWRNGGWVDSLQIVAGGGALRGQNQHGNPVSAKRGGGGGQVCDSLYGCPK